MKTDLKNALANKLLALADDELILGHRNSEWCGHAPILEEDIAFANIALDEIGHANLWYILLADVMGEPRDTYPDKLVFHREVSEYRCVQMVEFPKGDWAFTMLRQYLFDSAENLWLENLTQSEYPPIAEAAAKIRKEELYHLRHTRAWVRRLGLGTEESNRRMQAALDQLWACAFQLFAPLPDEALLVEAGYVPKPDESRDSWRTLVEPYLRDSGLTIPTVPPLNASREQHMPHLVELLADMQSVARLYLDAHW